MPRKKKQDDAVTEANASARPKSKSTRAKKPAAKKTAARRKAAVSTQPSDEDIQLRAYFISERRRRFDLPGDASSDWLEATRQLLSEAGQR